MKRVIVALVLSAAAGVCFAQADQTRVDGLIAALDAPTLDERERATMGLVNLFELTLDQISEKLDGDEISPEQRRRLMGVGSELFSKAPKGGLGVQFGQSHPRGVQIERTVDNGFFPAAALLEPGDVITHADGRKLSDSRLFRVLIISRLPGESIALTVERGGEVLAIDAPLGSFVNLGNAASIDPATATAAYRERRTRLAKQAEPAEIATGLTPEDWIAAAYETPGPLRVEPDHAQHQAESGPVYRPAQFVGGRSLRERSHSGWAGLTLKSYPKPTLAGPAKPRNMTPEMKAMLYAELMSERSAMVRQNKIDRQTLENSPDLTPGEQALIQARILDREDRMIELDDQMQNLAKSAPSP